MIENKNETTVETVASVDIPKVKKPRTEKQLAATAKLLENNKMKRELLKKHKESLENVVPVVPVVPVSAPPPIDIDNEIVVPKVKKVYKKRVKPDEKPKVLPPPLEYSDSSSSEEEMEYHQHPPTKPKRLARRFRIH
jgi:hypothetical protein